MDSVAAFHAGQRSNRHERLAQDCLGALPVVPGGARVHPELHEAVGLESGVCVAKVVDGPAEQARRHHEHEAERQLRGDEHAPPTQLPADLGRDPGSERGPYPRPRGQQCRHQPDEHRRHPRQCDSEDEHPRIQECRDELEPVRDIPRFGEEPAHSDVGDDDSGQRTESDEQRAFGQQLQHDAAARRAYRQPNGDLLHARGCLRDLQARNVRAGNREQEDGHRHDC